MNRRKLVFVMATLMLCFGVIGVRAVWEGRSALSRGDDAQLKGDTEGAVRWWRRSARWYVPLAPHVGRAYQRLRELGLAAEKENDTETALAAWRGVRSSIRATRSFYTPYAEHVDEADMHIATLMAGQEVAVDASLVRSERETKHYGLLKLDQMPSVLWSLVALFGLTLWIGAGFAFALRGINELDRLVPKAAAYSGAGVALGLLLWLTGLHLA